MTIQYFGKNIENGREYPEAEIWYNEDSQKEEIKADKIFEILEGMGWECFGEVGMITIPLYNGRYEYSQLVEDYKEAKRIVKIR